MGSPWSGGQWVVRGVGVSLFNSPQPRSTRNEYPIRADSAGFQKFFFSLRSNISRGQSTDRRRKRSMF